MGGWHHRGALRQLLLLPEQTDTCRVPKHASPPLISIITCTPSPAVCDIYPEAIQLKKGDYTLRAILRHDDAALLDRLKVSRGWG